MRTFNDLVDEALVSSSMMAPLITPRVDGGLDHLWVWVDYQSMTAGWTWVRAQAVDGFERTALIADVGARKCSVMHYGPSSFATGPAAEPEDLPGTWLLV